MSKRGQFYLIAALVIIGIVAGLAGIYNFAKISEENVVVYDLTHEADYEASQVIDKGIFQQRDPSLLEEEILNLTDHYARTNPGSDLIFLYGDGATLSIIKYNNSASGSVGINFDGGDITFPQSDEGRYIQTQDYVIGDEIQVILPPNIVYTFELGGGQVFYIMIKKEDAGESFVIQSDVSGD